MNHNDRAGNRNDRREQLVAMWEKDKRGQAAVLSMCHGALPEGETLRAGMSIFDVILDEEFGKPANDATAPYSEGENTLHRDSA